MSLHTPGRREFLKKITVAIASAGAIGLIAGGQVLAQPANPILVNARVVFHTNDNDKDHDTHVSVIVRDSNGVIAARVSNDFGHFDDHSDNGPFALIVTNPSTKDSLERGTVTIRIDPNGHDEWHFNFTVTVYFSDGTSFSAGADGQNLDHNRKQQEHGTQGIIRR